MQSLYFLLMEKWPCDWINFQDSTLDETEKGESLLRREASAQGSQYHIFITWPSIWVWFQETIFGSYEYSVVTTITNISQRCPFSVFTSKSMHISSLLSVRPRSCALYSSTMWYVPVDNKSSFSPSCNDHWFICDWRNSAIHPCVDSPLCPYMMHRLCYKQCTTIFVLLWICLISEFFKFSRDSICHCHLLYQSIPCWSKCSNFSKWGINPSQFIKLTLGRCFCPPFWLLEAELSCSLPCDDRSF